MDLRIVIDSVILNQNIFIILFLKREKNVSVDFVSAKSIIKTPFHELLLCTRC